MALSVVWTAMAQKERSEILHFYSNRNGNTRYSKELAKHFKVSMGLVAEQELLGKPTDLSGVRCLFVLDYSLFYTLTAKHVAVLSLWDNRRDPDQRPY